MFFLGGIEVWLLSAFKIILMKDSFFLAFYKRKHEISQNNNKGNQELIMSFRKNVFEVLQILVGVV